MSRAFFKKMIPDTGHKGFLDSAGGLAGMAITIFSLILKYGSEITDEAIGLGLSGGFVGGFLLMAMCLACMKPKPEDQADACNRSCLAP